MLPDFSSNPRKVFILCIKEVFQYCLTVNSKLDTHTARFIFRRGSIYYRYLRTHTQTNQLSNNCAKFYQNPFNSLGGFRWQGGRKTKGEGGRSWSLLVVSVSLNCTNGNNSPENTGFLGTNIVHGGLWQNTSDSVELWNNPSACARTVYTNYIGLLGKNIF